jgi:hypothetical protein
MDQDEMAHAATTQRLMAGVKKELNKIAEVLLIHNKVAMEAHELALLTLRAMCETDSDFRARVIRLVQEPANNNFSADFSQQLLKGLADQNRSQFEKSTLRPVPSNDEPSP